MHELNDSTPADIDQACQHAAAAADATVPPNPPMNRTEQLARAFNAHYAARAPAALQP